MLWGIPELGTQHNSGTATWPAQRPVSLGSRLLSLPRVWFPVPRHSLQAETYRRMKKATKNRWEAHVPATNVFWLQVSTVGGLLALMGGLHIAWQGSQVGCCCARLQPGRCVRGSLEGQ